MLRSGLARVCARRGAGRGRVAPLQPLADAIWGEHLGAVTSFPHSPAGGERRRRSTSAADEALAEAVAAHPQIVGQHHEGSIYLHHSDVGAPVNSIGLTIGLMHSLRALCPGVGYFRPIDNTSHGGKRGQLIRDIFKIKTPLEDMVACDQAKAFEMIANGQMDDLVELILPVYERCKAEHDFVVIEGTSLKDGSNTLPINALLASTFGAPALILNDAEAAARTRIDWKDSGSMEDLDWEKDAVGSVMDHSRVLKQSSVDVAGALFYRVPKVSRGTTHLQQLLEKAGVPFVGGIPKDLQLEALQVEDVKRSLEADVLYGADENWDAAMSAEINRTLVATLHLEDFLSYIPVSDNPSRGALVVAHASRPDVLLGLMVLHETTLPTQVAALLLTGGSHPPIDIDAIIRSRSVKTTLPVLLSPMDTAATVIRLANCTPEVFATSTRKIERAEVLFQHNVDLDVLNGVLFKERPMRMNAKMFEHNLFVQARKAQKHIVLPEGDEPRTVQAAGELMRREICSLTLLGDPAKIQQQAKQLRVDLTGIQIINPADSPTAEEYARMIYEKRKEKGVTMAIARDLVTDVTVYGTAMVAMGHADGMVSGAVHTTAATVRPALQIIKTSPQTPLVSSVFFMCLPDKVLVYGDCAVNENPNPEELATIAISSADTAAAFGIEPRVAMLSYATGDSNSGPLIQKVADATAIAKKRRPDLKIEGPLQYDAAVNPETAKTKMKGKPTEVAGKATVLIFPDLNTGNNTYKAVQQSTGAVAMGPLLQGLRKPVNDLSRGCTVKDIVTTVAMTALQAAFDKK